jgi:phosphatidylglycerol---prolipoprotein diacylglyceryl transferase
MLRAIKKYLIFGGLFFLLAFLLRQIFVGHIILPQYFNIGPIFIHYYGIIMAFAVLAGYLLAIKRARNYGIEKEKAEQIIFWIIIGGFIGARVYHVLSSFGYYLANPLDILKVWQGGLSIYGAVFGGLISLMVFKKFFIFNISLLTFLDWLTPPLIFGQIVGRFGNLFNYEAFGYPTNLPWKMFVPENFRPENFTSYNYFHPWFLYEALGNALILVILYLVFIRNNQNTNVVIPSAAEGSLEFEINLGVRGLPRRPDKSGFLAMTQKIQYPGALFLTYVLLYNVLRLCLELMRIDSVFIGSLRLNFIMSLVLAIIAAGFLVRVKKNDKIS